MDNLTDIAVFVRVVDAGSFTAAGESLALSQSVVSKSVSRLEQRLGTRLLNRTTRRLNLTEAGAALYERSAKGLAELEAAELEATQFQTEPRGVLRISAPVSFTILHLAIALPEFLARFPAVTVDMKMDDRFVDLVEAGFDIALRVAQLPDSGVVAKKLAPSKHVVCASPEYLKRHGTPRTPEDLRAHNCLV